MPLLRTKLNRGKVRQFIALCLVQIALFLGLGISNLSSAAASAGPLIPGVDRERVPQLRDEPLDLEQGANQANEASEKIFQGLDATQGWMGQTEQGDRTIERARENASKKWKSLSDKARRAQNSDESLSPSDRQVLETMQTGQQY